MWASGPQQQVSIFKTTPFLQLAQSLLFKFLRGSSNDRRNRSHYFLHIGKFSNQVSACIRIKCLQSLLNQLATHGIN